MKKLFDYLFSYLFGWLLTSNRPQHAFAGMLVYVSMITICLLLGISVIASSVVSLAATCIVAVSVDYKDKLYGGKFDWLDVAATVLLPGVITLLVCIIF